MIGPPGCDGLLDLLWCEVFGGGSGGERGELGVGGEAEGDELGSGEGVGAGELGGWEQGGETEALLEADDAVLSPDRGAAGDASENQEREGHDDPPEEESAVLRPVVDGDVDGETEVDEENWGQDEVERRIVAGVVPVALGLGHGTPFMGDAAETVNGLCAESKARRKFVRVV